MFSVVYLLYNNIMSAQSQTYVLTLNMYVFYGEFWHFQKKYDLNIKKVLTNNL